MKEFIEKLIGRLEEYKYSHLVERDIERLEHCKEKEMDCEGSDCFLCVWDKATEIVNQLAEEYNNEAVKGDLICRSDSIEIIEKELSFRIGHDADIALLSVKKQLSELPTAYNDGWIACSERLPEERFFDDGYVEPSEAVLVLTKYNSYKVSRYWGNRRNKRDYHDWVDIEYRKNEVIAWKPIAPYQPKGE